MASLTCRQRITAAIDAVAIDRIFTNSVRLTDEAVVEFVKQMCTVANEEISADHPRIFLLQKVVGVATYNMGRIKIVWSRLWEQMSAFFQEAGPCVCAFVVCVCVCVRVCVRVRV